MSPVSRRKLFSLRATGGYVLFAALWILLSDQAVSLLADPQTVARLSTLKGLAFVGITAVILWLALQNTPNDDEAYFPAAITPDASLWSLLWGVALPSVAALLQWVFWSTIEPLTWLLLYPAVFLASWLGGWWAGLTATVLATALGWYVFIPPGLSWRITQTNAVLSMGLFFGMGLLFSLTHEWSRRNLQRTNDTKFQALVEQSLAGIYIVQDGMFRYVNPEFARIVGYDHPDDIINQVPVADLVVPEQRHRVARNLQRRIDDMSQQMRYSIQVLRRDGSTVDLEVHGRGIQTAKGAAVVGLAIDVSERLRTEAALRRSEQLLRAVVEGTTDAIFVKDLQGRYLMANQACSDILKCPLDHIIGHDDTNVFPSEIARFLMERDQAIMRSGTLSSTEEHLTTLDGKQWLFLVTKGPMFDDEGKVVGLFGISRDISEIHQARQSLQSHQEQLEATVQQRTAELEAARNEAERLAHVKSDFLANMSHEIRTPLNGVLGLAQIGHQNAADPATHALFDKILESGQVLLGVVNDILDFSKIEAGKMTIEILPVDLPALLQRTLQSVHARAQAQGLILRLDLAPDVPANVATDPLRLEQILLNLLTNAVKFTRQGHIDMRARCVGDELVLTVLDTGIGMSEAQLRSLFAPFTQADNSTTRQFGGTGLGLTITKRLVEMLGGRITVHSRPDEGSCFEVLLPLSAVSPTQEARPPALQTAPPAMPPAPPTTVKTLPVATALPAAGGRLTGLTILAAEDNHVNQIVLNEFLSLEGAHATFVDSGHAAIEQIRTQGIDHYDLVLMDVQMPGMDGYEATRQIKALAPDLPVIGQTAHAMAEERQKCLNAGMVDMVAKPLDLDKLVQTITRHAPRTEALSSARPSAP